MRAADNFRDMADALGALTPRLLDQVAAQNAFAVSQERVGQVTADALDLVTPKVQAFGDVGAAAVAQTSSSGSGQGVYMNGPGVYQPASPFIPGPGGTEIPNPLYKGPSPYAAAAPFIPGPGGTETRNPLYGGSGSGGAAGTGAGGSPYGGRAPVMGGESSGKGATGKGASRSGGESGVVGANESQEWIAPPAAPFIPGPGGTEIPNPLYKGPSPYAPAAPFIPGPGGTEIPNPLYKGPSPYAAAAPFLPGAGAGVGPTALGGGFPPTGGSSGSPPTAKSGPSAGEKAIATGISAVVTAIRDMHQTVKSQAQSGTSWPTVARAQGLVH